MLQGVRLLVRRDPVQAQHLTQEALGQAVPPQAGLRLGDAPVRQRRARRTVHREIPVPCQAVQHLGHARG